MREKENEIFQQHAQFGIPSYASMQMNPLNPMQQYMQHQYPPYGPGYGFDPATYQQAAANPFWHGYANPHYGKANGAAMGERDFPKRQERGSVPGNMMPPAMMYPNYQNGVNNMVAAQNAYRAAAGYPAPTGFNTAPNQFPSGLPGFNYPNQFFK